jgi:CheY-like chemotaxis protein/HPt (histidine-containing phosphotransfer) domain-containing protein
MIDRAYRWDPSEADRLDDRSSTPAASPAPGAPPVPGGPVAMGASRASPAHQSAGAAGCRVLVVDDDVVCQDIMLLMLERLGYHADIADDGAGALSALHAGSYDVVLMDVRMPRMDGMEATRLIRSQFDADHQPAIVAMSADTTPGCQKECLQAGMDGQLGKPVSIDDLATALENRHSRQWRLEALDIGDPLTPVVPVDSATVVYDAAVLESFLAELGAEGAVRVELIESFIGDCRHRLTAIEGAGESGDLGALGFEAHAIKSAGATIGLHSLSGVAAEIEQAAKGSPGEVDVGSQALRLAVECTRAIDALTTALSGNSG